jgi:hypothetical protein
VADALRALAARGDDATGLLAAGLDAMVCGDAVLPAVRRLDIYANMYFYRLLDALKEDFPVVQRAVGEGEFHNFITDYLLAHPPSHPSLRYAGAAVPAFLASHRLQQPHPFLADLARFEWALVDAFDAPDAAPMAAAALSPLRAAQWPTLRLDLSPSLQVLALDWSVAQTWQRAQESNDLTPPAPRRQCVRVWRRDLRVWHHEIGDDEVTALQLAADGEPFAMICDALAERAHEQAAHRAGELLQGWFRDGLIVGYR